MATLTIELPSQRQQTEFNLRRWDELLADHKLAKIEGRVETDRHGHIIMSPPPAANHGSFQFQIGLCCNGTCRTAAFSPNAPFQLRTVCVPLT